jgi:uncharacterized glyoxalase superfamily protein PhnB
MRPADLLAFLRAHRLAVQASSAFDGAPQAAVVGFGVSDSLEIIFDTLETTRKCENLRRDPRIALVIGWDAEKTAQIEGVADFPVGAELARIREVYFAAYPDGRDRLGWAGITHVRVRPTWARYSEFTTDPPRIDELHGPELASNVMSSRGAITRTGFHSITPRLVVADVAAQVSFLREVFDARGELAEGRPAELRIGDSLVMISQAEARDVATGFLYVYVSDPDAAYQRALCAGASSIEAPLDTPYGDRRAMVRDPHGNLWQLARVSDRAP